VLAVLVKGGGPMSKLGKRFDPVPQLLQNVRFDKHKGQPLEDASVQSAIRAGEDKLGSSGRVLIRKSGTEPLIRVMAEGDDDQLVSAVVSDIVAAVEAVSK